MRWGKHWRMKEKYSEAIEEITKALQYITGDKFEDPNELLEKELSFLNSSRDLIYTFSPSG